MKLKSIILASMALMIAIPSIANAGAEKKCMACHTFNDGGKNKMGPNLFNLLGRKAGSVDNFKYGSYLSNADFVWTEEKLRAWDFDAKGVAKKAGYKTKMPKLRMSGERENEVVAFFKKNMSVEAKEKAATSEIKEKMASTEPATTETTAKSTGHKAMKMNPCSANPCSMKMGTKPCDK